MDIMFVKLRLSLGEDRFQKLQDAEHKALIMTASPSLVRFQPQYSA